MQIRNWGIKYFQTVTKRQHGIFVMHMKNSLEKIPSTLYGVGEGILTKRFNSKVKTEGRNAKARNKGPV